MYRQNRFSQILSILEEKKFVTTEDLGNMLFVSNATIRRDLAEMARSGLILRRHGGASLMPQMSAEKSYRLAAVQDSSPRLSPANQKLSRLLYQNLKNDWYLFIDTPTLESAVAAAILNYKGISVVTGRITLPALLDNLDGNVFCVGGELDRSTYSITGDMALGSLNLFRFHCCIISDISIDADGNVLCASLHRAALLRAAIHHSEKKILLISETDPAIGKHYICHMNQIDKLFCRYICKPEYPCANISYYA